MSEKLVPSADIGTKFGVRLAGLDPLSARAWLKPHLAADLKRADAYLAKRHPDHLTDVMAVDLADYGVR